MHQNPSQTNDTQRKCRSNAKDVGECMERIVQLWDRHVRNVAKETTMPECVSPVKESSRDK